MTTSTPNFKGTPFKPEVKFVHDEETDRVEVQGFVINTDTGQRTKIPQTAEEIDRSFPPMIPKPIDPEPPSSELLDLYKRAIEDPTSLMEKEVLEIHDWVPEAVANERCLEKAGVLWEALVTTAIDRPQELTCDEISLLEGGRDVLYDHSSSRLHRDLANMKQPADVKKLRSEAIDATTDPRYAIAKANITQYGSIIRNEREELISHLSFDDGDNIRRAQRIPWKSDVKASDKRHWGLICFRTSFDNDEIWQSYKDNLERGARAGLLLLSGTGIALKKWKLHFLEDKDWCHNASIEDLCKYFNNPPSGSPIPELISSGLRGDVFLFADSHTINSVDDPPSHAVQKYVIPTPDAPPPSHDHLLSGYVNIVDAAYEPGKAYDYGFEGVLKVHPAHISTTFYHRLLPRGQEKGKEKWSRHKQSIETMYRRANGIERREGGIYPPYWQQNN